MPADDYTAPDDLQYKAVFAETAEEIDTIAEASALAGIFAANVTRSEQFDDLVNDTPYYFAVLTKDGSDNISLSLPVSATPRSGPSSACDILSISLESMGAGITSTGTYTADTYFFSFPPDTDITNLLINYSLSPGATLYLEEDEITPWQSLDMTDGLIVKVVAADGVSFQNYQLLVNFVRERRILAFMLEHTSGGAPLLFTPDFSPDHRNYNTASSVAAVTLTINAFDWMEQDFVLVKLNSGSWVTPAELNRHNFTLINGNNTISAKIGDDSEIIYSVFINASF